MLQFPESNTAAHEQLKRWNEFASRKGGNTRIVSHHVSKSVELPVLAIEFEGVQFWLRDNFHGHNLLVVLDKQLEIDLSELYEIKSVGWYAEEMEKVEGYTFQGWSPDEIDDPRILRVRVNGRWSSVSGDAKDRWLRRARCTDWYKHDWSGNFLIRTDQGYALAKYAYCEGMQGKEKLQPYRNGETEFVLAGSWERCERVMNHVLSLLQPAESNGLGKEDLERDCLPVQ